MRVKIKLLHYAINYKRGYYCNYIPQKTEKIFHSFHSFQTISKSNFDHFAQCHLNFKNLISIMMISYFLGNNFIILSYFNLL